MGKNAPRGELFETKFRDGIQRSLSAEHTQKELESLEIEKTSDHLVVLVE